MDENRMKVLLIEDSPVHRELIKGLIEAAGAPIDLEVRETLAEGLERISGGGVDAVLLDLLLPDSSGLETLWKTLARSDRVAIVVLTSLDDENLAVQAVKRGAQDYLGKEELTGEVLVRSIRHAIERKRLQSRLETYAADLERNNVDLRQFLSVATERMGSPIRQATETCRSLLEDRKVRLDEPTTTRVRRALDGIERMRRLLEDFRTYAGVGVPQGDSRDEAADCEAALSTALRDVQRKVEESGLQVTHGDLPTVRARPAEVSLLFRHLLDNAIKFRGPEPPRVHIEARPDSGGWLLSVKDNGRGIEPEYPGQIFEAFQTLGESGGTGIGLAICRRIVETNGGQIWVESQPGTGSTFHFSLPAAAEQADQGAS